jgi:hypothetical protein
MKLFPVTAPLDAKRVETLLYEKFVIAPKSIAIAIFEYA